jgi:hypothetical protein
MGKDIWNWDRLTREAPRQAELLKKFLKEEAESDLANSEFEDEQVVWYDSDVDYVGRPPGLEGLLQNDATATPTLGRSGTFIVKVNPTGQVYNPGPFYLEVDEVECKLTDLYYEEVEKFFS